MILKIYTDGSALNEKKIKLGQGGWSVFVYGIETKEYGGVIKESTSQLAEITALVNGMKIVREKILIDFFKV